MDSHHMISTEDQKHTCPYCGCNTGSMKWDNKFDNTSLYKETKCSCGKKVMIKMPFMGSGDDSWNKSLKDLDKRIEEDDPKSQKKKQER